MLPFKFTLNGVYYIPNTDTDLFWADSAPLDKIQYIFGLCDLLYETDYTNQSHLISERPVIQSNNVHTCKLGSSIMQTVTTEMNCYVMLTNIINFFFFVKYLEKLTKHFYLVMVKVKFTTTAAARISNEMIKTIKTIIANNIIKTEQKSTIRQQLVSISD